MASFEFDQSAFDELEKHINTLTITCPICQESFDIALDEPHSSVVCPHCNANIEIDSN